MSDEQDLTKALAALAAVLRAPTIVRYLANHPESFYGQILHDTNVPTSSLARHLADLETHGIVSGDIPVEGRRGRAVRYRVDTVRADLLLEELRMGLLG